jgi:hypothetical protein
MVFRKPPVFRVGSKVAPVKTVLGKFENDTDLAGTMLANYAKRLCEEVIAVGRAGSLVDWNDGDEKRGYLSFIVLRIF